LLAQRSPAAVASLARTVTGLSSDRQHHVWHNDDDTSTKAQTHYRTENYISCL
jgi:hypothetical protein